MQTILKGDPEGFLVWLGVLCASWSIASRGTTLRSWLDPLGNRLLKCVQEGNAMVCRTCGSKNYDSRLGSRYDGAVSFEDYLCIAP